MSNYTIEDVRHLIPEALTPAQEEGIVTYLNTSKVPPADPCLSCEPNLIRKYIARIQAEERAGRWPVPNRIKLEQEFVPAEDVVVFASGQEIPVSEFEDEDEAEEKPKPKPRTRSK